MTYWNIHNLNGLTNYLTDYVEVVTNQQTASTRPAGEQRRGDGRPQTRGQGVGCGGVGP